MPLKFSRIINNQRDKKQPFPCPPSYRRFKEMKSLSVRKAEYATLKAKFPNKVMVVNERYAKERYLPLTDKTKFLVPEDLCASKLIIFSIIIIILASSIHSIEGKKVKKQSAVKVVESKNSMDEDEEGPKISHADQPRPTEVFIYRRMWSVDVGKRVAIATGVILVLDFVESAINQTCSQSKCPQVFYIYLRWRSTL